jgi:hypothetical protein
MCLHYVATVQERHLPVCLNPYFVPGMLREDRQGGDVESEFSAFCKLAYWLVSHVLRGDL